MRVPEVIQYGTRDRVTLDCDYVTSNVTGLVVKWFYEDKSQPVYQWIPPQKPQALGILKNKVGLESINLIILMNHFNKSSFFLNEYYKFEKI